MNRSGGKAFLAVLGNGLRNIGVACVAAQTGIGPAGRCTCQRLHAVGFPGAVQLINLIRTRAGHRVPAEGHAVRRDRLYPQVFRGAGLGVGSLLLVFQDEHIVVVQLGLPITEPPGEAIAVRVLGQVVHGGRVGFAARCADAAAGVGAEPSQHAHGQAAGTRTDLGLKLVAVLKVVALLCGAGFRDGNVSARSLGHRLPLSDGGEAVPRILSVIIGRRVARCAVEDVAADGFQALGLFRDLVVGIHRDEDLGRFHRHHDRTRLPAALDFRSDLYAKFRHRFIYVILCNITYCFS